MSDITWEEKIDYIYKNLKSQIFFKRFKFIIKLLIFSWIIYFLFFFFPYSNQKDELFKNFWNKISEITKPIIIKLVSDINEDLTSKLGANLNIKSNSWSKIDIKNIKLPKDILLRLKKNPDILKELLSR